MDGQARIGQRSLTVRYQIDRHAPERIKLAYERIDLLPDGDPAQAAHKDSVQTADATWLIVADIAPEIQG